MKLNKIFLAIQVVIASLVFASCEDTLDVSSQIIGDGEATVDATLEFKTIGKSLGGSRSAGNAICEIKTLDVAVYNEDGNLFRLIPGVDFENEEPTGETPPDYPTPDPNDTDREKSTAKVSFKTKLPYGRYYMYAVANLHRESPLDKDEIPTIDDLKAIRCEWDDKDISNNDQMFGYFTNDVTESNTAFDKVDPQVVINQPVVNLHSWIKRLASKVTVAYDGKNLLNGVYVYIHNVSVRQIPLTCTLGGPNKAGPNKDNGEEVKVTPAYFNQSVPDTTQAIYYNTKGIINKPTAEEIAYKVENYKDWMIVSRGVKVGSTTHANTDQALFFYENMQGVLPDRPKPQNKDEVGQNVGPEDALPDGYTSKDYLDGVEYGTFIEVEAYYKCDIAPVSYGAIRYRFMLGQNVQDDYDVIRNHHYKVTLGFNGYANQPDWHIEYSTEDKEIYATEVYIPYTYNTSVEYPVTIKGNLTKLTAEIIENNWAPYDAPTQTKPDEVAPAVLGETDFSLRTLEFEWWRDLYLNYGGYDKDIDINTVTLSGASPQFINSASNYLYGRHKSTFYHLNEKGEEDKNRPYYVTPVWAGFLRLQVPEDYDDAAVEMPAAIIRYLDKAGGAEQYGGKPEGRPVLTAFRNYYFGKFNQALDGDDDKANTTNLSKRVFLAADLTDGQHGGDVLHNRNSYRVERKEINGEVETTIYLQLWTQPKSMCGISGFSGNNPYEDFKRKAVIRFTAEFADGTGKEMKDVEVFQTERLTNPKAVWRSHANPDPTKSAPDPFHVTLYQRNTSSPKRDEFMPMISQGEWTATIKPEGDDFFKIDGGTYVVGNALNPVDFNITFNGNIGPNETRCGIIEIKYHNNTCVHNIYVRQGYNQPIQIDSKGPYWSAFNVYSADADYGVRREVKVPGVLAKNPVSFGAYFKRGNYRRAMAVSNISDYPDYFGPLNPPGAHGFVVTGVTGTTYTWSQISAQTALNWEWNDFNIGGKTYRVPTIDDFKTLLNQDFGIGVLYGDGATAPANNTAKAFGFIDGNNNGDPSPLGMRGFICYNTDNAHQIFFPVGTTGMGRRTIQAYDGLENNYAGTLRYGSVEINLNKWSQEVNSCRPIPMNMKNAPGVIYWVYKGVPASGSQYYVGWDMNYFDLNFNGITNTAILITKNYTVNGVSYGGNGDAIPLRLVTDTAP